MRAQLCPGRDKLITRAPGLRELTAAAVRYELCPLRIAFGCSKAGSKGARSRNIGVFGSETCGRSLRIRPRCSVHRRQALRALVALVQVLLTEGERRYLRDCGIATLPLALLNAVLAPLGYMLVGSKTRAADRFVLCTDARGQVEPYGLFELRRVAEGNV